MEPSTLELLAFGPALTTAGILPMTAETCEWAATGRTKVILFTCNAGNIQSLKIGSSSALFPRMTPTISEFESCGRMGNAALTLGKPIALVSQALLTNNGLMVSHGHIGVFKMPPSALTAVTKVQH